MKKGYKDVRNGDLKRTRNYFKDEDFEDWKCYKNENHKISDNSKDLEDYEKYKPAKRNSVNYLRTALRILDRGKNLATLTRQDFIFLIAEIFAIWEWSVYLPKKYYKKGVDILIERKFNFTGVDRCVIMVKKTSSTKAGLRVLRELEYLIIQENASKGAIVTTSSLTSGAIEYINGRSRRMFYFDKSIIARKLKNFRWVE